MHAHGINRNEIAEGCETIRQFIQNRDIGGMRLEQKLRKLAQPMKRGRLGEMNGISLVGYRRGKQKGRANNCAHNNYFSRSTHAKM